MKERRKRQAKGIVEQASSCVRSGEEDIERSVETGAE